MCCRVVAIASSPQGLQFTCSSVGRLLTTNPTGELNAPRVGKLSVWDLRTMKAEVWSSAVDSWLYTLFSSTALDILRWLSQRCSPTPQFLECTLRGTMTTKFKLGGDICTMHLPRKFYHHMFTRLEVIVLSNKHTNRRRSKTSSALRYTTTLGNQRQHISTTLL